MNGEYVIGVDLGGTNVRAAAVGRAGEVSGEFVERPSRAKEGAPAVIEACVGVIREVMAGGGECAAVGMAVPGHIDSAEGIVRWAPNFGEFTDGVFRHFADVRMGRPIEEALGVPVRLGNDANLAALGEYRFGSGGGTARGLVMITLGTGVGGGVVLTREQLDGAPGLTPALLVGSNGGGAELGHTVVLADGPLCGCGAYGCLEALVNAAAIRARAAAKLEHGAEGKLRELSGGDPGKVTPKLLADAAEEGDEVALEVWRETGHYLGVGIANFINTFVPEVVAVGGQISKVGEPLMAPARLAARNHTIPTLFGAARIVTAVEVERAGVLGGAALAMRTAGWA